MCCIVTSCDNSICTSILGYLDEDVEEKKSRLQSVWVQGYMDMNMDTWHIFNF